MYLWPLPTLSLNKLISKATIDTVFETARVEEVIGDFVQLKRAGSNFKGLSPFSDERSPSFMVSPAKGIWKDFSTGKGDNAVVFLMEHEHFTYPDAIRYLKKKSLFFFSLCDAFAVRPRPLSMSTKRSDFFDFSR